MVKDKSIGHMLKIRTCNHTLSVEIDRYQNRKTYDECICKACDLNQVEDLFHVIVACPKYSDLRVKYLPFVNQIINTADLYTIMNELSVKQIKQLSEFIVNVEDIRIKLK